MMVQQKIPNNISGNFYQFKHAVSFPDLLTVLGRNVDELSGGELQRFACAVVCIQRADM